MSTQFFKSKAPTALDNCHDGVGSLVFYDMIKENEMPHFIKFIHHDILKTGVTIGNHFHGTKESPACEEWYYCVAGKGIMYLDGKEYDFEPGDICVCREGGEHGLQNPYEEDLDIIVVYASQKE